MENLSAKNEMAFYLETLAKGVIKYKSKSGSGSWCPGDIADYLNLADHSPRDKWRKALTKAEKIRDTGIEIGLFYFDEVTFTEDDEEYHECILTLTPEAERMGIKNIIKNADMV